MNPRPVLGGFVPFRRDDGTSGPRPLARIVQSGLASAAVQEFFDRVREGASSGAWGRGVELARAGAVLGEPSTGDEVVVRVRTRGAVHPTVILYLQDAEWECDCGGREDPCEHVAAAAIAVRRAQREGQELPSAGAAGRIGYRLTRALDGLALERSVAEGGEETHLTTTLTALVSGRVPGPEVVATQADLAAEQALGPRLRGDLPRGTLRSLLRPLASCPDVTLDGAPIRVSPEPVGWCARLVDDPLGFRLRVELDPPIEEALGGGFALCAGVLRELAPSRLTGRERDELLGAGRTFTPDQITELLSEVIPSLESRLPVSIETERLPSSRAERPRIQVEIERDGDGLSVLATLVYGDPPVARVDAGRLTHLRGPVPLRDESAESALAARLGQALGLRAGHRVTLTTEESLTLAGRLGRFDALVRGDAHHAFFRTASLEPRIQGLGAERFDLRFAPRQGAHSGGAGAVATADAASAADGAIDAAAVVSAWKRGSNLVSLDGGGFAPLPLDWLARHGDLLADLLAARRPDGQLAPAVLPDLVRFCDELGEPRPHALSEFAALLDDHEGLPAATLPSDLRAELRGYQRKGIDWLVFLGSAGLGGLLADDMGLGKTLQALAAIRGRTLVVAPTSVLPNWSDEISRFRPGLRTQLFHGAGRALDENADITLTSYALLRRDQKLLSTVSWDCVVLDEAQAIKNPDSQVARAAYALQARQRLALTGTPVENRLEELWSQLHFLNPGLLGGRSDFEERYAGPIGSGDDGAAVRLRQRIRPFVLRRRKAEVAPELPPRTDIVLRVELSETERSVYDAVRAATLPEVVKQLEAGGGVMAALEALLRLRQACCHTALLPGQQGEDSAKLTLLMERLETVLADGHRALVFSQWTSLLDLVEPLLGQTGTPFLRLDGSTRDRAGVVRRFQSQDGPPVFLVSLRAGGTGLNLTNADHVFLLDPWWNPAVEDQAADRTHRIGQERPVFVHRLVARDSVEERILDLQGHKRSIAEAALGETAAPAGITRDELMELLR